MVILNWLILARFEVVERALDLVLANAADLEAVALEEETRAGINHKESMLVELGRLARVPEAAVAPRVWRGGLIAAQGTPGKGVLGDQIIDAAKDAAKVVVASQDHVFFLAFAQQDRAALRGRGTKPPGR